MDRLATLQQALDRTTVAARRYRTDPHLLEVRGTDILTSRSTDQSGWVSGALQRLLLDVADDHHGCAVPQCATCEALRCALAISMAALENMQREELEARLVEPRPVGRFRRWNATFRW